MCIYIYIYIHTYIHTYNMYSIIILVVPPYPRGAKVAKCCSHGRACVCVYVYVYVYV